jgi:hypothetical protein
MSIGSIIELYAIGENKTSYYFYGGTGISLFYLLRWKKAPLGGEREFAHFT